MDLIKAAVDYAKAEIITLAVRRTNTKKQENILDYIRRALRFCQTLPVRNADEAVRIARMARKNLVAVIS